MKEPNLRLVDKRTYERNIHLGHLREEEYQKFVKSIPDDGGNFDSLPFEEPEELEDGAAPGPPSPTETPKE